MQKYIKLEGFVKSNNEAIEAVVQHLAEKYKIKKRNDKKNTWMVPPLTQRKHTIFSIKYMR